MTSSIKQFAMAIPLVGFLSRRLRRCFRGSKASATFAGSANYWNNRYVVGGNSGRGSYGELAEFKAAVLNDFVENRQVKSVIEFGCGDGNQLTLAKYPSYLGFDVSPAAIQRCRESFVADGTREFALVNDYAGEKAELSMSLDVIYHLVEDTVFEDYMVRLFGAAERFVVIYASNHDEPASPAHPHVRHRKFTEWIAEHRANWKQLDYVANPYPYDAKTETGSFADFYFFSR